MIDLNKLCMVTLNNAELRNKNGGNIKTDTYSMLKHTATEVVEATESFVGYREIRNLADDLTATDIEEKWESQEEPDVCEEYYQESKFHFESELADIICCVLIIAGKENIDIEKAVLDCIEKNRKRAEGVGDKL